MAKIDDKLNMRMVGEGSLKNKIIKLININGLDKKIIIQNYDNNPYDLYKKAKTTVLVSKYEGMPNVLLESISLGTPVVSFDIDHGPREIIKNGVNGFLVPNGDRKLFIKRVFEIINGDKVFNINNLKKSINKFSLENVIDKYEKEIKRIADKLKKMLDSSKNLKKISFWMDYNTERSAATIHSKIHNYVNSISSCLK